MRHSFEMNNDSQVTQQQRRKTVTAVHGAGVRQWRLIIRFVLMCKEKCTAFHEKGTLTHSSEKHLDLCDQDAVKKLHNLDLKYESFVIE